ncbi:hypothetical protein MNEG_11976 [Monoraphidium neglectum]|uniref:Uncharacterized protein n=1 Tax=Monoraphidium neglectum TaxID=145388 RepID=A0A0D2MMG3_9CHLO|nr:hypothetical protein MNEG_11976 [Monoraphidium neglectum]KIY95985.1 hypothetical protein MNEG_11976 [Monoraphidium neglectum]|eukprot:XP_013895005.1 hypothetical protein MNEG_11976 [Monoraphidium neglectum]
MQDASCSSSTGGAATASCHPALVAALSKVLSLSRKLAAQQHSSSLAQIENLKHVCFAASLPPVDAPLPRPLIDKLMQQLAETGGPHTGVALSAFKLAIQAGSIPITARARQAALHPGFIEAVAAFATKSPADAFTRMAAAATLALLAHACDEARRGVVMQGDVTVDLMLSCLQKASDASAADGELGSSRCDQLLMLSVLSVFKEAGGARAERATGDAHALRVAAQLCDPSYAKTGVGRGPALLYLSDAFAPPRGRMSEAEWLDRPPWQPPPEAGPLLEQLFPQFASLLLGPDVPRDARLGLLALVYRLLRMPGSSRGAAV